MHTHKDSVFPFTFYQQWLMEEHARWRAEVYVPPHILLWYDGQQSLLVYGVRGSGLSMLARLMGDIETERNRFVVYWTPQAPALLDFVKTVVTRLEEEFTNRCRTPNRAILALFSAITLEALHGLLTQYYFEGNAYRTKWWLQRRFGMTPEEITALENGHPRLAPTTIVDTIDDLLDVVYSLGYDELVGIVPEVTVQTLPHFQEWMNNRALQSRRGLRMIVTVRDNLHVYMDETSRWMISRLDWHESQIQAIANNALSAALGKQVTIPQHVFDAIKPLFDRELGMTPYGATALAEALYWWLIRHDGWPTDMEDILHWLYLKSIPLRYDEVTGDLYRGLYRLPTLSGVPSDLLDRLYRQGRMGMDKEDLLDLLGSGSNAHMVARRIRGVIEPTFRKPFDPLYLKTRVGDGYILDNIEAW